jgi:hypothetical protein
MALPVSSNEKFMVAGGSVAGRDHRKGVPKNRQDDFCILRTPQAIVIVVSDGCGSGGLASTDNHTVTAKGSSEVGASIAVRLLATGLERALTINGRLTAEVLVRVQRDVEAQIRVLAINMGQSLSEVVDRYFLFTLLGAVITENSAYFFGLGDGVLIVNGKQVTHPAITASADNEPIYLGYALTGSKLTDNDPSKLNLQIIKEIPAVELEHFLLGSDGVEELMKREGRRITGLDQAVGLIESFWTQDKYIRNPAAIERNLNLAARDVYRPVHGASPVLEGGLLFDDTTIVVGRPLTLLL